MVRKYFGTDGIRGKANEGAMTAETALRVGMAAGRVFRRGDHRQTVVIAIGAALSGNMPAAALTAGF
ncbi:phosphoglucosamine mutase, partial [Klebsiella pneumoniae]|nr:phosphoglucosamine mutase [Klebsiella pneumoniae]